MVEPLVGEQLVPTVIGVDTLLQPAPALLGEMKVLPYLQADSDNSYAVHACMQAVKSFSCLSMLFPAVNMLLPPLRSTVKRQAFTPVSHSLHDT